MALNENDLRFFRPLWIRILVTAVVAGWCLSEIVFSHDQLWIGLTGFGVVYCLYNFFWKFPRSGPAPATDAVAAPADTPPADEPAPKP